MSEPITVIIADNHALVLEGLCSLFSAEEDIRVVETVADGRQLIEAVCRHRPDVVITDIEMDYQDGLSCLNTIRDISGDTRVLILTAYTDGETLQAVLQSGADGLLLKTDPPEQATRAVRQVMAGQLVFPAAARRWLGRMPSPQPKITLSERGTEVLQLVARCVDKTHPLSSFYRCRGRRARQPPPTAVEVPVTPRRDAGDEWGLRRPAARGDSRGGDDGRRR